MPSPNRARLVPELKVTNIERSLTFWCIVLGFSVLYDRPEDGFAYLDLHGAQLMLDLRGAGVAERRGIWETGAMEYPLGRGINLEIQVGDLDGPLARVGSAGIAIYFGPEERWYRSGTTEIGVRQFLVQDPDGYLVRLQQTIGHRPITTPTSS